MKQGNVFSLDKIWQLIMAFGCGLLITCFSLLLIFVFGKAIATDPSEPTNWIFFTFFLGGLLFSIYALVWAFRIKLTIWEDKFEFVGIFSKRELLFSNVAGFRASQDYLTIYAIPGEKNMKITKLCNHSTELFVWLNQNFLDLDHYERHVEESEILKNEAFGESTQERFHSYINTKNAAILINLLGIGIGISLIAFETFVKYTFLAVAIYPPLIAITLMYYKGLLRLATLKSSSYPTVAIAFFGSILALFIHNTLTFLILDLSNVWTGASLIAVVLFLLLISTKEFRKFNRTTVPMVFVCAIASFAYGYSVLIGYNCLYDTSNLSRYSTKVLSKRISDDSSNIPYITIGAWGPVKGIMEMDVDDELYNQIPVGGRIDVYLFEGQLGIPWYTVEAP